MSEWKRAFGGRGETRWASEMPVCPRRTSVDQVYEQDAVNVRAPLLHRSFSYEGLSWTRVITYRRRVQRLRHAEGRLTTASWVVCGRGEVLGAERLMDVSSDS